MARFKTDLKGILAHDELREDFLYAEVKDGFIYATDARIMIKQKLSEVHDIPSGYAELLEGRGFNYKTLSMLGKSYWETDGDVVTVFGTHKGARAYRSTKGAYLYEIRLAKRPGKLPDMCEGIIAKKGVPESLTIMGVNPLILKRLSDAMCVSDNALFMRPMTRYNDGFVVRSREFPIEHNIGIFMPILVTDEQF